MRRKANARQCLNGMAPRNLLGCSVMANLNKAGKYCHARVITLAGNECLLDAKVNFYIQIWMSYLQTIKNFT